MKSRKNEIQARKLLEFLTDDSFGPKVTLDCDDILNLCASAKETSNSFLCNDLDKCKLVKYLKKTQSSVFLQISCQMKEQVQVVIRSPTKLTEFVSLKIQEIAEKYLPENFVYESDDEKGTELYIWLKVHKDFEIPISLSSLPTPKGWTLNTDEQPPLFTKENAESDFYPGKIDATWLIDIFSAEIQQICAMFNIPWNEKVYKFLCNQTLFAMYTRRLPSERFGYSVQLAPSMKAQDPLDSSQSFMF